MVLALTNGEDGGSLVTWNQLRWYGQAKAVAFFGLRPLPDSLPRALARTSMIAPRAAEIMEVDPFHAVCELTGGMLLRNDGYLTYELRRFVGLLRDRYIVEFPRPLHGTSGEHNLLITLGKKQAFIRPAGMSFPTRDATTITDPMSLPPDETKFPEEGTRRVLTAPH